MNCKLFVKIVNDITLHSYYCPVTSSDARGCRALARRNERPCGKRQGLQLRRNLSKLERTAAPVFDSPQPYDFPAARLCRTHQMASDRADCDDCMVRILFWI